MLVTVRLEHSFRSQSLHGHQLPSLSGASDMKSGEALLVLALYTSSDSLMA